MSVNHLFARVRNLTIRYLPNDTLFPIEVTQYDPWVLRETLHNCIVHEDYPQGGKINVVERPDSLLFTNLGEFLPGTVEEAIRRDAPLELYPNRFLAEAMVNLNMIDTIGSGIKRMFTTQQKRNFIRNLLQEMRKDRILDREGANRWSKWHLTKTPSEPED